jgi:polyribonucleotide nucleotidyltransferase
MKLHAKLKLAKYTMRTFAWYTWPTSASRVISLIISRALFIIREAEVGQVYHAKVKRIEKYGAFVELFPGKDALLHIYLFYL